MKVAANTAKILRNVPLPDEVAVTHTNAAVLDMGSNSTRLGFAGDNAPRMYERTDVWKPGNGAAGGAADDGDGADLTSRCFDRAHARYLAEEKSEHVHRCTVMENGLVKDWEGWEQLMQRVDAILLASHAELNTPLLLTEKPLVPHSQRQKMAEILFETHRLNAVSFALSPVLALYASGLCTGVSVELGNEQSHVVPVFQGFSLFHATHRLDFGGRDLTALLMNSHGESMAGRMDYRHCMDVWAYLKEQHCVTLESHAHYTQIIDSRHRADTTSSRKHVVECRLPDGTIIELGPERNSVAEAYFNPPASMDERVRTEMTNTAEEVLLRTTSSDARGQPGLHHLIEQSIRKCDEDLFSAFYNNIALSGGASLLRGLPRRLEHEVQALMPTASADRARVTAEVERQDAAFVGGSILASLPTFQDLWVTKADYDENGPMAVVRGCY